MLIVLWPLAIVGGLLTFFVITLLGIVLFYDRRSHVLCAPVLEVLERHYKEHGKEFMTIAEITEALRARNLFSDRIPKLFGLYASDCLTTDACRKAMNAELIRNIGNLIPCYQLSSIEYTPPRWP